jgi:hypothetical protein
LLEAAINDVFFQLELWNAVAKQSTDAVSFFVDDNSVTGTTKLLGSRETGGA